MKSPLIFRRSLPVPARTVWHWHTMPGAFTRLAPPWQNVRLDSAPDSIADGTQVAIELKLLGFKRQWIAEHFDVHPGHGFSDRQLLGPFREWVHHHRFLGSEEPDHSVLEDEIHFRVPGGALGRVLTESRVRREVERMFAYRHAVTAADAARHWRPDYPRKGTLLVTGHTGLIGGQLTALLRSLGYTVRGLTRHPRKDGDFHWDPAREQLDPAALEGVGAVFHLAGAGIADHRWTKSYRRMILDSRRQGTRLLATRLAAMDQPPQVLVSASGANFYPLDGQPHDEGGPMGEGFLSGVCRVWESAADPARKAGIRVVHPRLAAVLSPAGGALAKMLPAFRMGAGGPLGTGRQLFSWVGLDDVLDVLIRAFEDERMEGPVNVSAPEPVPQREFAATLGRVLHRPAVVPAPAPAIRLAFGRDLANETVLADQHIVPGRLRELEYVWRHADLESALRHYLGRLRNDS